MKKHRFVTRTIRKDGTIKWDGRKWRPTNPMGIEQLIGRRLVFGTYAPWYDMMILWGTVEEYKAKTQDDFEIAAQAANGVLTVNGYLVCQWWTEANEVK